MKGYFCLLIVLGIASCSKNDRLEDSWIPEQKKQVVIMQQTGTWCGACPGGATVLRKLVNEFESEVVPIAIHGGYDDPMRISCFSNFRSDRSYSGFPSFFITETRYGSNFNNTKGAVETKLEEAIEASTAFRMSDEGDSLVFETKTAFYASLQGAYYLSIYITEDSIFGGNGSGLYDQSGAGANYYHEHVLRATSTASKFWGEEIIIDPAVDQLIEKTFKIPRNTNWIDKNLKYSAVLWKYDPSATKKYTYINAFSL